MRLLVLWLLWAAAAMAQNATEETGVARPKRESSEKKIVCYYTNWSVYRPGTAKFSPQNINPYLCTHLIYAFGGLTKDNALKPFDKYQDIEQGGYAKFNGLKTYNKNLKTMVAIGGWNEGSARFSPLVADAERRRELVKNTVKFLRQNHFDGLDLDWEYPSFRDGGKPRDRENYATLVQEFREEFDRESDKTGRPRLLLTMAVPAGIEYIDKGYDVKKLNKYLDWMNILSYDYHSAFEPSVNHHSPLFSLEEDDEYNFDAQLNIDHTVQHYIKLGADRSKLVLGIPTYGRSYTLFNPDATEIGAPADGPGEQGEATREKGYLAYYEICERINTGGWTVDNSNSDVMGPYAYKDNQWVGYDDENIVRAKAKYVNDNDLGGIMFWSIDNDDFRGKCHGKPYPLIEAAKEALLAGANELLPSGGNESRERVRTSTKKQSESSGSGKRKSRLRNKSTTTTESAGRSKSGKAAATTTTPLPPTTPDPGSDFTCKEEGFFPHPRDCKKYFWCLDSGPSSLGIVAHQFTCPSGLVFNKISDSCDYARNVICKNKPEPAATTASTTTTTTTTTARTTTARSRVITASPPRTTTTTTTTTTTPKPSEAPEYEYEEDDEEEDPGTIKELINLIKKLGGVEQLEKQLNLQGSDDKGKIKPSLYSKVLQGRTGTGNRYRGVTQSRETEASTSRYVSLFRNRPNAPQSPGSEETGDDSPSRSGEKPRYVTIQRNRTRQQQQQQSLSTSSEEEEGEEEESQSEENRSGRQQAADKRRRKRPNTSSQQQQQITTEKEYVTLRRARPAKEEQSTTSKYRSIVRSRSTTPATSYQEADEDEEEEHEDEENGGATREESDRDDDDVSEEEEDEVVVEDKEPVQKQKKYSSIIRDNKRIVSEVEESKVSGAERRPPTEGDSSSSTGTTNVNVNNVYRSSSPRYLEIRRGQSNLAEADNDDDVNIVNNVIVKEEDEARVVNGVDQRTAGRHIRFQGRLNGTFSSEEEEALLSARKSTEEEDVSRASEVFTIVVSEPTQPTVADVNENDVLAVTTTTATTTAATTQQRQTKTLGSTPTSTETAVVTSITERTIVERRKISKKSRSKVRTSTEETLTTTPIPATFRRFRTSTARTPSTSPLTTTTTGQVRGFRFRVRPTSVTVTEATTEKRFIPKRNYKKFLPPVASTTESEEKPTRFVPKGRPRLPTPTPEDIEEEGDKPASRPPTPVRRPVFPSRRPKEDLDTQQSGSFFKDETNSVKPRIIPGRPRLLPVQPDLEGEERDDSEEEEEGRSEEEEDGVIERPEEEGDEEEEPKEIVPVQSLNDRFFKGRTKQPFDATSGRGQNRIITEESDQNGGKRFKFGRRRPGRPNEPEENEANNANSVPKEPEQPRRFTPSVRARRPNLRNQTQQEENETTTARARRVFKRPGQDNDETSEKSENVPALSAAKQRARSQLFNRVNAPRPGLRNPSPNGDNGETGEKSSPSENNRIEEEDVTTELPVTTEESVETSSGEAGANPQRRPILRKRLRPGLNKPDENENINETDGNVENGSQLTSIQRNRPLNAIFRNRAPNVAQGNEVDGSSASENELDTDIITTEPPTEVDVKSQSPVINAILHNRTQGNTLLRVRNSTNKEVTSEPATDAAPTNGTDGISENGSAAENGVGNRFQTNTILRNRQIISSVAGSRNTTDNNAENDPSNEPSTDNAVTAESGSDSSSRNRPVIGGILRTRAQGSTILRIRNSTNTESEPNNDVVTDLQTDGLATNNSTAKGEGEDMDGITESPTDGAYVSGTEDSTGTRGTANGVLRNRVQIGVGLRTRNSTVTSGSEAEGVSDRGVITETSTDGTNINGESGAGTRAPINGVLKNRPQIGVGLRIRNSTVGAINKNEGEADNDDATKPPTDGDVVNETEGRARTFGTINEVLRNRAQGRTVLRIRNATTSDAGADSDVTNEASENDASVNGVEGNGRGRASVNGVLRNRAQDRDVLRIRNSTSSAAGSENEAESDIVVKPSTDGTASVGAEGSGRSRASVNGVLKTRTQGRTVFRIRNSTNSVVGSEGEPETDVINESATGVGATGADGSARTRTTVNGVLRNRAQGRTVLRIRNSATNAAGDEGEADSEVVSEEPGTGADSNVRIRAPVNGILRNRAQGRAVQRIRNSTNSVLRSESESEDDVATVPPTDTDGAAPNGADGSFRIRTSVNGVLRNRAQGRTVSGVLRSETDTDGDIVTESPTDGGEDRAGRKQSTVNGVLRTRVQSNVILRSRGSNNAGTGGQTESALEIESRTQHGDIIKESGGTPGLVASNETGDDAKSDDSQKETREEFSNEVEGNSEIAEKKVFIRKGTGTRTNGTRTIRRKIIRQGGSGKNVTDVTEEDITTINAGKESDSRYKSTDTFRGRSADVANGNRTKILLRKITRPTPTGVVQEGRETDGDDSASNVTSSVDVNRARIRVRVRSRPKSNETEDQLGAEAGRVVPSPFNSLFRGRYNNSTKSDDGDGKATTATTTATGSNVVEEATGVGSVAGDKITKNGKKFVFKKRVTTTTTTTTTTTPVAEDGDDHDDDDGGDREQDEDDTEVQSPSTGTRTNVLRRGNQDYVLKRRPKTTTTTTTEAPTTTEATAGPPSLPRRKTILTERRRFRPESRTLPPRPEVETETTVTSSVRQTAFTRRRIRTKGTTPATTTTTTTTTTTESPEDSKLEESQDSSNIPDLADPAVVAIHNLATVSPGPIAASPVPVTATPIPISVSPVSSVSSLGPVRFGPATPSGFSLQFSPITETPSGFSVSSRTPITLFTRQQFVTERLPKVVSTVTPLRSTPFRTAAPFPVPRGGGDEEREIVVSVKPFQAAAGGADTYISSGSIRGRTTQKPRAFSAPQAPVTPKATETKPRKPKPFTKVQKRPSAVIETDDETQPFDYQVYDDVDEDPLANVPASALKVKVHSDGYIECLDRGNFPHPFSCKKFISCARMENNELLGWEYTCPKHLSFDPVGGICNWSAGLGCQH